MVSGAAADVDDSGEVEAMAYDADTGRARWAAPQPVAGAIAEDPRHDAVIVADTFATGMLERLDLATGTPERTFDTQTGGACYVVTSSDGRYLAAASCARSRLALWSLAGGGATIRHVADAALAVDGPIVNRDGSYLAINPDGRYEGSDQVIELDVASGALTPVELPPGYQTAFGFRPNGHAVLITADGRFVESTEVVERPTQPFTLMAPYPFQLEEAFRGNDEVGDTVAIQPGGVPHRIWVVPDARRAGQVAVDYEPGTIGRFALNADGSRLLVGGTEGVRVYDTADGRLVDQPFTGYNLATDGGRRLLAVGQNDGSVVLRDLATLEPFGDPIAAPPSALVAFSPDGSVLRVMENDDDHRRMRLYDVATQAPLGPVVELGPGTSSDILPDSTSMLVQREGSMVDLGFDPDDWLTQACLAAGRNLTVEEWATYLGGTPRATCPQWPAPTETGADDSSTRTDESAARTHLGTAAFTDLSR